MNKESRTNKYYIGLLLDFLEPLESLTALTKVPAYGTSLWYNGQLKIIF